MLQFDKNKILPTPPVDDSKEERVRFDRDLVLFLERAMRETGDGLEEAKRNVDSSAPSNPKAGDMYFNSSTDTLYIHNGTVWVSEELT